MRAVWLQVIRAAELKWLEHEPKLQARVDLVSGSFFDAGAAPCIPCLEVSYE